MTTFSAMLFLLKQFILAGGRFEEGGWGSGKVSNGRVIYESFLSIIKKNNCP